MHTALRDTLKQAPGAAQPAHALRLVASRHVEDPERKATPAASTGRESDNEGVARGDVEPQAVLDAAEPPHRIGVRPRGHRR